MALNIYNENTNQRSSKGIRIEEVAALLSVSTATIRNWIKSGKIQAINHGRSPIFDEQAIMQIKNEIESGASHRLKSRRNKRAVDGTYVPTEYVNSDKYVKLTEEIIRIVNEARIDVNPNLILLEVILGLLVNRGRIECPLKHCNKSLSELAIKGNLSLGIYDGILNAIYDFNKGVIEAQYEV